MSHMNVMIVEIKHSADSSLVFDVNIGKKGGKKNWSYGVTDLSGSSDPKYGI